MKDFEMTVPMQDAAAEPAPVAIDAALTAPGARAYILHDAAAGDLPAGLHPARFGGEAAEAVRVAAAEADLAALAAAGRAEAIDLPAEPEARAKLFAKWAKRAARKHRKAALPLLLLPLAACGGGDDDGPQHVSREIGGADSGTTVTITGADGGATVTVDSQTAGADTVDNLELDADGEGTLTIAFDDADDTLVLSAASDISGFTRIEVVRGTVDFTAVTLPAGLTIVYINSGAIFTHAQFMAIPAIESDSGDGHVTVIVATVAEARQVAGAKDRIDGAVLHIDIDRGSDAAAVLDVADAAVIGAYLVDGYTLSDSLADLTAAGDAVLTGAEGVALTDTGAVSAADLAALDARVGGTIDASSVTAITGTLDAALAALRAEGLDLAGDIAVTVTGTALDADDLAALDALTTGTITLTQVESVFGTHAAITAIIDSNEIDTDPDPAGVDVEVTDTITAAQADAIATSGDIGDGILTATLEAGTAEALNDALTDTEVNHYTITIIDETLEADDLAALNALDGKTSGTIDAASVTALTDAGATTAAAFVAAAEEAYGSDGITGLGDETIAMQSFNVTVDQAVRLANLTRAEVTASISDSAANLAAASDAQFALVTGTVTADTDATASEAATLQAFTTPVAYDIDDSATAIAEQITTGGTAFLNDAHDVTVTGTGTDATGAALATTILGASNSGTTRFNEISGTVTQILALPIGVSDTIGTLTVTGTVTAQQAEQLDALAGQDNITAVTYDAIPETGDATVTMGEDGTYTFSASNFVFSDADDEDGGTLASVVIQAAPTAGTLEYNGGAIGSYPFPVDAADIGLLTFRPADHENGAGYAGIVFTVVDDDGTASDAATITVNVTAENDPPTLGGDDSGDVQEDSALTASGALTITDPDAGESLFAAAAATTTYGSYTLTSDGVWTYTLDNSNATVQELGDGETTTDTFTAES
ncbi:MAG: VCBS domain-containing protein, partial [Rhodobacteraceae bacterium]|nr:VCBS domain-containing protein [Paracoccaceae bacterium]